MTKISRTKKKEKTAQAIYKEGKAVVEQNIYCLYTIERYSVYFYTDVKSSCVCT
jgi:hypothetical protein